MRNFARKSFENMKKQLYIFAFIAAAQAVAAQTLKVDISNSLDQQRREIVEIDTAEVANVFGSASNIIVKNALGQEIAHQISYDGKLLFEASVRPNANASYTIVKGSPSQYQSFVYGQVWSKRLDDLTWENDCAVYRMYGPALQLTGERSFGTDLWTKSIPYPDTQERYEKEFNFIDNLTSSYHLDHGTGYDAYAVGPTLGCGAPALIVDGQLKMPYCWQECKILDNGPLRFTALLTYGKTTVGKDKNVVEHRLISLDKGSHYNEMTVWYDGLTHDCPMASGVVVHSADTTSILLANDCALYADPTDRPELISEQVYVGTLYPSEVTAKFIPTAEKINGVAGHAVGIITYKPNSRFTYYFGSSWSGNDIRTWQEWQLRSRLFLNTRQHPLSVTLHT